MRITNKVISPVLFLALSVLAVQPTISSNIITGSANTGDVATQSNRITARGTRSDVCCSTILSAANDNAAPRRGIVRSVYEVVKDMADDNMLYSWNDRRGTRFNDAI